MAGLGINIDHIATLRQARRGRFPEPVFAAGICEVAGCDSIVCHLREDRRHIQDRDVYLLKAAVRRLNLEMAVDEGIIKIALDVCPAQVTLVPEKREELTTEGGLDVSGNLDRIKQATDRFHEKGIVVSLFIDPDFGQIDASKAVGADAIEIHTGKYADLFEEHQESQWYEEYEKIMKSAEYAMSTGIKVHAGHGLDYRNIHPILSIQQIQEFNIGYSIICKAVFIGLYNAVKDMVSIIEHLPE